MHLQYVFRPPEVQTEHQNKNERGMTGGGRWTGLNILEAFDLLGIFNTEPSLQFTENRNKIIQ